VVYFDKAQSGTSNHPIRDDAFRGAHIGHAGNSSVVASDRAAAMRSQAKNSTMIATQYSYASNTYHSQLPLLRRRYGTARSISFMRYAPQPCPKVQTAELVLAKKASLIGEVYWKPYGGYR